MDNVDRVIQREAYQIYKQRIKEGRPGNDKSDWEKARQNIGLINEEEI